MTIYERVSELLWSGAGCAPESQGGWVDTSRLNESGIYWPVQLQWLTPHALLIRDELADEIRKQ